VLESDSVLVKELDLVPDLALASASASVVPLEEPELAKGSVMVMATVTAQALAPETVLVLEKALAQVRPLELETAKEKALP
jgi:hypothetical protein